VLAIDTAFETSTTYDVVASPLELRLVERTLEKARVKRYAIEDAFAHWSSWDTGFVADEGGIVGFAGVEYEAWHRRVVLWHLYVVPARRRSGIGRALLERVEAFGRERGAKQVWLETSNINVPGIAAYARLGYALCGMDTTEYEGLPYADETAIYLAKAL
jgi:ribosomal protein S18 acetylase RimI-like enzyme